MSRVANALNKEDGVEGAGLISWKSRWSVMRTRLGRPTAAIVLSKDEREKLERWARRSGTAQALALRSRIVLGVAAGSANTEIAAALCRARSRWPERRTASGASRTISEAKWKR